MAPAAAGDNRPDDVEMETEEDEEIEKKKEAVADNKKAKTENGEVRSGSAIGKIPRSYLRVFRALFHTF